VDWVDDWAELLDLALEHGVDKLEQHFPSPKQISNQNSVGRGASDFVPLLPPDAAARRLHVAEIASGQGC
jgi:hypothetical protein